jgi:hypothetical protein
MEGWSMYACMHVRTCVCMHVLHIYMRNAVVEGWSMYVCMHACTHVCMYACYTCIWGMPLWKVGACMHACTYICMHAHICRMPFWKAVICLKACLVYAYVSMCVMCLFKQ